MFDVAVILFANRINVNGFLFILTDKKSTTVTVFNLFCIAERGGQPQGNIVGHVDTAHRQAGKINRVSVLKGGNTGRSTTNINHRSTEFTLIFHQASQTGSIRRKGTHFHIQVRTLNHQSQIFIHRFRIQPQQDIHTQIITVDIDRVLHFFAIINMVAHSQKVDRLVPFHIHFHQAFIGHFFNIFITYRTVFMQPDDRTSDHAACPLTGDIDNHIGDPLISHLLGSLYGITNRNRCLINVHHNAVFHPLGGIITVPQDRNMLIAGNTSNNTTHL